MIIRTTAYASVGLVVNRSDSYHGKTIAALIKNFAAGVTLYETAGLEVFPGQEDSLRHGSTAQLTSAAPAGPPLESSTG